MRDPERASTGATMFNNLHTQFQFSVYPSFPSSLRASSFSALVSLCLMVHCFKTLICCLLAKLLFTEFHSTRFFPIPLFGQVKQPVQQLEGTKSEHDTHRTKKGQPQRDMVSQTQREDLSRQAASTGLESYLDVVQAFIALPSAAPSDLPVLCDVSHNKIPLAFAGAARINDLFCVCLVSRSPSTDTKLLATCLTEVHATDSTYSCVDLLGTAFHSISEISPIVRNILDS